MSPLSPSLLSSLTNDFQEFIKQIGAVLGAWGALWMVLYTESPVPDTLNTFNRSIQQIDMGNRKRSISQAFFFDGIGMILGSDLDFSCLKILYRMIAAAVAEFEFVGAGAVGKGQDLVAQADPENREAPDQRTDSCNGLRDICGIARSVAARSCLAASMRSFVRYSRMVRPV